MIIYSHPDICPIWNYMQVVKTCDLRYLCKLDDYSFLPDSIVIDKKIEYYKFLFIKIPKVINPIYNWTKDKLRQAWENINYNLESGTLNLDFERIKRECWEAYVSWIAKFGEAKYNQKFASLRIYYDRQYSDFTITREGLMHLAINMVRYGLEFKHLAKLAEYENKIFKSFSAFYKELSNSMSYYDLLLIRMRLFEIMKFNVTELGSFFDEITNIEQILGCQIDPHLTSVSKYFSYRKKAKDLVEKQKKHNGKKAN